MSQRGRIGSCSIRVCLYLKLGCFVHQFCLFFSCIRFWFFKTRCIRRHHSFDTLTLCTCEVSLAPLPSPGPRGLSLFLSFGLFAKRINVNTV